MLRNFFLSAFRHWNKHKRFTLLNLSGLSIGLAVSLLVALYVHHESSFDQYHTHIQRMYRIGISGHNHASGALPIFLKEQLPEIEKIALIDDYTGSGAIALQNGTTAPLQTMLFVGKDMPQIFDFQFLTGNEAHALENPYSLVLTRSECLKLFGHLDAVGKVVSLQFKYYQQPFSFTITGIIEDCPANSSLRYGALAPFHTLHQMSGYDWDTDWRQWYFPAYALLTEGADVAQIVSKGRQALNARREQPYAAESTDYQELFDLYPMRTAHFNPQLDALRLGNLALVRTIAGVGLLVLLIAAVNFINLSTAKASIRAKEVGVRKALGSGKRELMGQFLLESILFTSIAAVIALLAAYLLLPSFNQLLESSASFAALQQPTAWALLLAVPLGLGLLAGSYPAWMLSAFHPRKVLYTKVHTGGKGGVFRNVLIVSQFVISAALIAFSLILLSQFSYIRHKDLGVETEQVVWFEINQDIAPKLETFMQQLRQIPGVALTSASMLSQPGTPAGWGLNINGQEVSLGPVIVDPDFIAVMGMTLLEGRNFNEGPADQRKTVILNETAARELPLPKPVIGQRIPTAEGELTVIGIVKDFHLQSLHHPVANYALVYSPRYSVVNVKVKAGQMTETLPAIQQTWTSFCPNQPFDYHFLDESFGELYQAEQRFMQLIGYLTALAIFITCLGLFGLVVHAAERREKEIGIRKVLGASVPSLVLLLAQEFGKLIAVAFLIAIPVANYAGQEWLSAFAYRTEISIGVFVATALLVVFIAAIAAGGQSIKAALANPIDSLRGE